MVTFISTRYDNLLITGFYNRKSGLGSSWNYDLIPLITNFSFYKFISDDKSDEFGGFIVITDKQYIIGYNAGFGYGTHASSFARVMKDINGGGRINSAKELMNLTDECCKKFIVARIVFENNQGYINFEIPKEISSYMYNSFEKFYEAYNDEIKSVANRYNFEVSYTDLLKKEQIISSNLDNINMYLKNIINNNYVEDELIIGVSTKNNNMKM